MAWFRRKDSETSTSAAARAREARAASEPSVPLLTRAVGVDFGTTTSLVADGRAGQVPLVLPIGTATAWMPSVVGLDEEGSLSAGEAAEGLGPARSVRSIKRAITRNEDFVEIAENEVKVEVAIGTILRSLAIRARDQVDLEPGTVRLGCPAMWTGRQRKRLLDIARASGLPVDDHTLIDEPVAAGVAWVNHRLATTQAPVRGQLLVFDMGGGTLDVAVLDVYADPGQNPEISVLSSWGVDEAGDALDAALVEELETQLSAQGFSVDELPNARTVRAAMVRAAREAKERLSHDRDTLVSLRGPGMALPTLQLSREQLEEAFDPQLRRAQALVWAVLRGTRVTHEVALSPQEIRALPKAKLVDDIDYVLVAGGMGRIPAVARMLAEMLPKAEISLDAGVPSDEAIVAGLAETKAYERINLHRPPFHFVLEHQAGDDQLSRTVVYEAHAPFYDPFMAYARGVLYHEWRAKPAELPTRGAGVLTIYTTGGQPVRLDVEGSDGHGIEVRFGSRTPAVLIYPNGRVLIIDGRGERSEFLVPRWPVIRGKDHAVLYAEKLAGRRPPVLNRSWMNDPLFLH